MQAGNRSSRRRTDSDGVNLRRALIVGAGSGGRLIARELRENQQWGMWPVGLVDDDAAKHGKRIGGLRVLGDTAALPALVEREGIDTIVIAIPSASGAVLSRISGLARRTSADLMTMPPIGSILRGEVHSTTLKRVRAVDVLGRPMVEPDPAACRPYFEGKRVMITGAAGSIGQELARQVLDMEPAELVIVDTNESDLHDRHLELMARTPTTSIRPVVCSITDQPRVSRLFDRTRPDVVFHAAAYKHVPMMEAQPDEAVRTNVIGTRNVATEAARYGAERFVLVSTDKAVQPTSVMGATKRIAEIVAFTAAQGTSLSVRAVRFGNVLASRGSVIPTFERQILDGGPVTVTDARMRRYFMAIPEAAALIIEAATFAADNVICMLDMGDDVSILELAEKVIRLHGLRPHVDMPIVFTGIRKGEKLREELCNAFERAMPSPHPKIRMLSSRRSEADGIAFRSRLDRLEALAECGSAEEIRESLHRLVRWADLKERQYGERIIPAGDPIGAASYRAG